MLADVMLCLSRDAGTPRRSPGRRREGASFVRDLPAGRYAPLWGVHEFAGLSLPINSTRSTRAAAMDLDCILGRPHDS